MHGLEQHHHLLWWQGWEQEDNVVLLLTLPTLLLAPLFPRGRFFTLHLYKLHHSRFLKYSSPPLTGPIGICLGFWQKIKENWLAHYIIHFYLPFSYSRNLLFLLLAQKLGPHAPLTVSLSSLISSTSFLPFFRTSTFWLAAYRGQLAPLSYVAFLFLAAKQALHSVISRTDWLTRWLTRCSTVSSFAYIWTLQRLSYIS